MKHLFLCCLICQVVASTVTRNKIGAETSAISGNKLGLVQEILKVYFSLLFQQKIVAWTGMILVKKNKKPDVHLEEECLILNDLILLNFFHTAFLFVCCTSLCS